LRAEGPSEERLEQGRLYLPPSLKLELKSPKRFGCIYCSEKFSTRSLKDQHMQMELDKKIREEHEKKKQGALERERKRQESHERRNEKMRRTSPAKLSGRIPRSLAMLQDKLSHNFVAEGRRARKLPEVFSPDFDSGKKKKMKKKMEDDEESESDKEGAENEEEEENSDSDGSNATTDVIIEELKPGELAQFHAAVPKTVSQLEDKLTGYFSPKAGKRTRKSPERLEIAALVSSGSGGSGRWSLDSRRRSGLEEAGAVDTRRRPQIGAVETSTPVEGRSVRARPRVSYAEVPDTNAFDLSTGDEESPFERRRPQRMEESLESLKKRFETCNDESEEPDDRSAATRSQRRFVLGSSLRRRSSSRRRDIDISSASSSESPRVRVTTGKQDLSQEITDLSHSTAGDQEEVDEDPKSPARSSNALPPKSPGKYQSSLTPGRGIKLVINRIKKPRQLELEMSSPMPLILPRLSRGVCKEMGISPNKLQSIMTQSPPPKPRPSQSTTPEKENRPRTPKLLLKRMPSSSLANSPLASKWKAETKLSPVKSVAARQTMESPGKVVYSPLSARSIHKLSTSPIISPHLSERRRHKKKVNKQLELAYNA